MNDPNLQGGREAARIDYITADDCHRESCLSLAEAQAITVRSPYAASVVSAAQSLLEASKLHRQSAAKALRSMDDVHADPSRQQQQVTAHSRMTTQLAIRALMLLNQIPDARSARQKLDFYLPPHRGDKTFEIDDHGEPALSATPNIFGSNRNGNRPERPRHVALLDIALNHLAQLTRNWEFTREHAEEFSREYLGNLAPGQTCDEASCNAWINRRIARAEATAGRS